MAFKQGERIIALADENTIVGHVKHDQKTSRVTVQCICCETEYSIADHKVSRLEFEEIPQAYQDLFLMKEQELSWSTK